MEIEILIDELTDCLIETATGKVVDTEYIKRTTPIRPKDYKGWTLWRQRHIILATMENIQV